MRFDPDRLILGCCNLGGLFLDGVKPDLGLAQSIVSAAYQQGIKSFDTAPLYGWGSSEYFLGQALETLKIPRKEVRVLTKSLRSLYPCIDQRDNTQPDFWTLGEPNSHFTHKWRVDYDSVLQTTQRSLEIMRLSYLDGLSFHDIGDAFEQDSSMSWEKMDGAIKACLDLKRAGFVREIGFGSKESKTLKILLERAPGLLNYAITTTYTMIDQEFLLDGSLEYCRQKNLTYHVAGPFCSRLLAEDPRKAVRRAGKDGVQRWYYHDDVNRPVTFNYNYISQEQYDRACRLWQITEEFGETSPRAAAIQFVLANPQVKQVVIGASRADHIPEMRQAIERQINPKLWEKLVNQKIISAAAALP